MPLRKKIRAKLPVYVPLTLDELHVATEGPLGLVARGLLGLLGSLLLGASGHDLTFATSKNEKL